MSDLSQFMALDASAAAPRHVPAQSPQPGADSAAVQQMLVQQQQAIQALQAQLLHSQQQQQQPPAVLDLAALAALLQQQQQAAQQQQLQATAQLLALQALGQLPTFSGKGALSGLAALEWLQQAERYFTARETALGVNAASGDATRVALGANALQEDAQRWYNGLPSVSHPTTWQGFRDALLGRYGSIPAVRVRVEQLRSFVDAARRLRDKMTLEGLQGYTSRFQQLASEIPSTHLTEHGKLELLARGLTPRLAEVVLQEDAKETPPPLHEIAQKILARAAFKEYAGSMSASSASQHGDAMQLDSISLCATQFGVSREEAARYVEPGEGWAPHDTDARSPATAYLPASSPTDGFEERMLAAFQRFHASTGSSSSSPPSSQAQGKSQSQRRNVPKALREEISEALLDARRAVGLCIKCGVVKYEPGGNNAHNSRTCKAAADKTTSVADGKKKAGF